ncbi:uncharacterized protein MELLADRAFT_64172 [Melampsora larici-populina 98AG31]|uniref:Uncharacterized protein n=1 Tax=Melampsora larici-populina (strain 98AG31 / pathotype 3-4-7) TaxID=747676 RepID=F4RQ99_MELLP|nr:uncharacterized protein MELLADRAFT_64172 [Melampsora larici-populina 98AG31]EGG05442.1 hypothetical protein MELLADRAFT_64172 [Melampsora larici-populina 98AG31]
MSKAETAKAKAIRASRRIQGLEIQPLTQTTTTNTSNSNACNRPLQSTSKIQGKDNMDDLEVEERNEDRSRDKGETAVDEPLLPNSDKHTQEAPPKITKNYIGHVPIPYPVGPIRAPRSEYEDSSSDSDDPENDFLDEESGSDEPNDEPNIKQPNSSDDSSDGSLSSRLASSASLGSSNKDQLSSSEDSTSDSSRESESGPSSGSESETSEEKSKKDRKRKRIAKAQKQLKEAKRELRRLEKRGKGKKTAKHDKGKKKDQQSSKKKKRRKGIQVEIGVIPNSNLVQLQPFWRKQMKKLHSSIPLTVFDQSFALADSEEYDKQHHSSSSKTTKNKGLDAPSEYKMSYGEWTENISLFKRYLMMHKHPEVAERINYHIKNVKQVKRSTECWMTALRYDILCRKSVFVEREDRHPIKDIGTFMKKYKEKAKDKSLNFGETNGGEANPYAKGGKLEFKHPETGQPIGYSAQHQPNMNSTNTQPIASSSREQAFRGRRRAQRPPRTQNYNQYPYQQGSSSTYNTFHPNQYQPFNNLQQAPLPSIHMGFQSQGSANNTSHTNTLPMNPSTSSTKFSARGGRGSWRGNRGGNGRQGQQET